MSPLTHRLSRFDYIVYLKKPGRKPEWRFAGAAGTPQAAVKLLSYNRISVLPQLVEGLQRGQQVQGPTWKVVA